LASLCSSPPARELAYSITPVSPEEAYSKIQEAREILDMIQFDALLVFGGYLTSPSLSSNRSSRLFPGLENLIENLNFFRLTIEIQEEAKERKTKEKYSTFFLFR
jgi:UDP-N-acetylglucosamine:LPS N-acetylglucosamine transferase